MSSKKSIQEDKKFKIKKDLFDINAEIVDGKILRLEIETPEIELFLLDITEESDVSKMTNFLTDSFSGLLNFFKNAFNKDKGCSATIEKGQTLNIAFTFKGDFREITFNLQLKQVKQKSKQVEEKFTTLVYHNSATGEALNNTNIKNLISAIKNGKHIRVVTNDFAADAYNITLSDSTEVTAIVEGSQGSSFTIFQQPAPSQQSAFFQQTAPLMLNNEKLLFTPTKVTFCSNGQRTIYMKQSKERVPNPFGSSPNLPDVKTGSNYYTEYSKNKIEIQWFAWG